MRIVYCILGTFNSGGMERVLANKANYFAKLGYSITIITTDQRDRASYFELDAKIKCIDLGINYTDDIKKGVVNKILAYIKKQKKDPISRVSFPIILFVSYHESLESINAQVRWHIKITLNRLQYLNTPRMPYA